jgi:hypothetical protein
MADYVTDKAVLSAGRLDRGVTNAGWIAVLHADGNGIGALFSSLPEVSPMTSSTGGRTGGWTR